MSFGACGRPDGMGGISDIGGTAELFTGRWFGDAGMERPNLGSLGPDCDRPPPGTGARSKGAGEAMLERSDGSTLRLVGSATVGVCM